MLLAAVLPHTMLKNDERNFGKVFVLNEEGPFFIYWGVKLAPSFAYAEAVRLQ